METADIRVPFHRACLLLGTHYASGQFAFHGQATSHCYKLADKIIYSLICMPFIQLLIIGIFIIKSIW